MPIIRMGEAKADELNIVMGTTNILNNVIMRKIIVRKISRENQTL